MNLISGTDKLIHAQSLFGKNCIALTPVGGNIRFVDLTKADLSNIENWVIRTAEDILAVTLPTAVNFVCVEAAVLRVGEIVGFYDVAGAVVGGGTITSITGTTVTYVPSPTRFEFSAAEIASITQIILEADPLLLDERTKPVNADEFKYILVQSDANLELSIEILQAGIFI